MKAVTILLLCLINVRLSWSCFGEGQVLVCLDVLQGFIPGFSSLVIAMKDVGVLNSSVLHSDALSSVTKLRFEGAGITGISTGAFRSLQNLTALSLILNQLTDIDPSWFSRPGVLSELGLNGNRIRVLNESTFEELTNLRKLSLDKNQITEIHPNTFSALTDLTELDLSDNRMTQVSPQVFRSLRSTRISLDGNPWDCSCEAKAFVDFVKDLRSRSLLNAPSDVTCESPPSLRGQAMWNVSVCGTPATSRPATSRPATSRPPTGTQTVRPEPTVTAPSTPASGNKTSNPPGPPNPTPSATSVTPQTTSVTPVTTPEINDRPTLSDPPRTDPTPGLTPISESCETSQQSSLNANITSTLIAVIVILACLLFLACFLAVHRRKRGNKTVTPERDGRVERGETSRRESMDPPKNTGHELDMEAGWRTSFTGVRAKSANAILFTWPFGAPVTDQVTLQSEATGKQEDEDGLDDESAAENQTQTTKQAVDGRNLDDRASSNPETVPYLSIGRNQNQNSPDELDNQPKDGQTERSVMEKVMSRVSTWPLAAMQWQTRCKTTEEEGGKALDVFTVMTPELLKEDAGAAKPPLDLEEAETEERDENPPEKSNPESSKFNKNTALVTDEQLETEDQNQQERPAQTRDPRPAEKSSRGSSKPEKRMEPKRAQREANLSSRAPSGGTSPDDETLLSGNQYAFMDLLHEVVQNNGRWTRERWRQTHGNKQRR